MRFVLFYHSLVSDWNHGNAHFLRGIATDLLLRGHEVRICEPARSWSRTNLIKDQGRCALAAFHRAYPLLRSEKYARREADIHALCDGADVIIAHEWNEPSVIDALSTYRRAHPRTRLLFHDTHHRAITKPKEMARFDLSDFDGALVYGEVLRQIYLDRAWARAAWTWHEAADTRIFRPRHDIEPTQDLVWIGNWGDNERAAELEEFLLRPAKDLKLSATIYGVRYPRKALRALRRAGVRYAGYLPNFLAPEVFALHRLTVHVPRRPYVKALPGIPTIRPFEALACGIPLLSSPWEDREHLFDEGDIQIARTGREMMRLIKRTLDNPAEAAAQARRGLRTIHARHTCHQRVNQLLDICTEIGAGPTRRARTSRQLAAQR